MLQISRFMFECAAELAKAMKSGEPRFQPDDTQLLYLCCKVVSGEEKFMELARIAALDADTFLYGMGWRGIKLKDKLGHLQLLHWLQAGAHWDYIGAAYYVDDGISLEAAVERSLRSSLEIFFQSSAERAYEVVPPEFRD